MGVQGHLLPPQNRSLLRGLGKSGPCWKVRKLAMSKWDHLQHPLHLQQEDMARFILRVENSGMRLLYQFNNST